MSQYSEFEAHRALFSALMEQALRVDPELRAAYAANGSGGIDFAFADGDWQKAIAALQVLEDDAGHEAAVHALEPLLRRGRASGPSHDR